MKDFINSLIVFIKYLLIAGIGPAVITLLFVVFTLFYWGGGLVVFGVFFIMTIIAGIGSLIIVSILKNRSTFMKIVVTTIVTFIVGFALQLFEYSGATPTKLKNAVLSDSIQDLIQVKEARMFNVGLEHEIYLELKSTPEYTKKLLRIQKFYSSAFGRKDLPLDAPSWFPKQFPKDKFDIFSFKEDDVQILHYAFVSKDYKTIFYFYLDY